jgi:hypothetical protein
MRLSRVAQPVVRESVARRSIAAAELSRRNNIVDPVTDGAVFRAGEQPARRRVTCRFEARTPPASAQMAGPPLPGEARIGAPAAPGLLI